MPIYEYHCEQCDADFEQLVRSPSPKPTATCPGCGGSHVRRKLSLFGMSGSGAGPEGAARTSRSACATCRASSCAGCRK